MKVRNVGAVLGAVLALLPGSAIRAQTFDAARLGLLADSLALDAMAGGRAAGMSIAVVRDRDTLVMHTYGFADLELSVPTPPNAIYEIGSVTKQFTSTALLQLHEQGALSLDDELTKYLPDYPTQGHRITLRRLLDHTSGIRGYTEIPEFVRIAPRSLPPDSLVAMFSFAPFDFPPGEAMIYNNSAYFLLGLVIEKVSGISYEDYVEQRLFPAAGMADSRYCSQSEIVKNRAKGYEMGEGGLQRASYLDHAWPYAAGSLCSTVGDLVAWNRALHGGRILGEAAYTELVTPGILEDGTQLRYAKGVSVDSIAGRRTVHHGGGIPGFLSELDWFPDDRLTIAVLINTAGPSSPSGIAHRLANEIYGPAAMRTVAFSGEASAYAGLYRGIGRGREMRVRITPAADGGLTAQTSPQGEPVRLEHLGNDTFALNSARLTFVRENGSITLLRFDSVGGYLFLWRDPAE